MPHDSSLLGVQATVAVHRHTVRHKSAAMRDCRAPFVEGTWLSVSTVRSWLLGMAWCVLMGGAVSAESQHYVFAYFKGNGEDGLHLAHSTDGLRWTALNQDRSFLRPTVDKDRLMRDPSLVLGPDGKFHMVWTTGWHDRGIGVAHSSDLIEWSPQQRIGVMDDQPACRNCWAPEIFYDAQQQHYQIIWATTLPDKFLETQGSCESELNHRMYVTTTKDFQTFTPTRLFYDPGFAVIDSFLVRDGERYVLISKNETRFPQAVKRLFAAESAAASGPFRPLGEHFSPDWVEGPAVLRVGEEWLVYFDEYTRHRYQALRTKDFVQWETLTQPLEVPAGMRHGTAVAVPEEIAVRLLAHTSVE